MPFIKLAEVNIELEGSLRFMRDLRTNWLIESLDYSDLKIKIPDEIEFGNSKDIGPTKNAFVLREISDKLANHNSFLLHSAVFDFDGVGIAFSAVSGTGKSTHLANWWAYLNGTEKMPESLKKLLQNKDERIKKVADLPGLTIVNGDKPIVRFFDKDFCKEHNLTIPERTVFGIPYAYGTPWCGKEGLGCNMRTPLKHICFIERSETNYVTKIEKIDAINRIMQQVYLPKDPIALSKTLELVNRLINSCELWIIHCNRDIESAEVAYKAIFGSKE